MSCAAIERQGVGCGVPGIDIKVIGLSVHGIDLAVSLVDDDAGQIARTGRGRRAEYREGRRIDQLYGIAALNRSRIIFRCCRPGRDLRRRSPDEARWPLPDIPDMPVPTGCRRWKWGWDSH